MMETHLQYNILQRRTSCGLSLIEMLIVVAVISLLVSIVLGVGNSIQRKANEQLTENTFALLEAALQEYYDYQDYFPVQSEENFENAAAHSQMLYQALRSIPGSRKIISKVSNRQIKNKYGDDGTWPEIYDPWKMPIDYRYTTDQTFPVLISAGPDRTFGNSDDISSK